MKLNVLKENIIDIIKEEQVKLGYRKETIRLYYPLASLNTLLGTQLDHKNMLDCLNSYFGENKDIFGDVDVSYKGDRFCLCLSDKASEYVHNNTEKIGCTIDFWSRLIHFEMILLNKRLRLGLCNKAVLGETIRLFLFI